MTDIFISYSHKDEHWKDELQKQLRVLERQGELSIWEDRQIKPGTNWLPQIEGAIAQARVVILLVSSDFLTSSFVLQEEIPKFLQRRKVDGLRVIPVLVRPCLWQAVPWLSEMQGATKDNLPLSRFSENPYDLEHAITEVASKVFEALRESKVEEAQKLEAQRIAELEKQRLEREKRDKEARLQFEQEEAARKAEEELLEHKRHEVERKKLKEQEEQEKEARRKREQEEAAKKTEEERLEAERLNIERQKQEEKVWAEKLHREQEKEKVLQEKEDQDRIKREQRQREQQEAELRKKEKQLLRKQQMEVRKKRFSSFIGSLSSSKSKILGALGVAALVLGVGWYMNGTSSSIGKYTDNGDGTITDAKNKLMWKKCSEGQKGETCEGEALSFDWDQAVAALSGSSFASYKGWRLPNVEELRTLVYCNNATSQKIAWDETCANDGSASYRRPTIDENFSPNSPDASYWSSSSYSGYVNSAWVVDFASGEDSPDFKGFARPVRLVRNRH